MIKSYDVVIIGAGTSGLSARSEVAKKTDNYLVVDSGTLGTTCASAFVGPASLWFFLGTISLLTGLNGWCPAYASLGISTCAVKKQKSS